MTPHRLIISLLALWSLALTACSSQTAYNAGQAWRQNQCNQIQDMADRQRCMKDNGQSYDSYQQDADKARTR